MDTSTYEMPALTVWQPWATLLAIGAKRVETRSWKPPATLLALVDSGVKPWIAIHAAARIPTCKDLHDVRDVAPAMRLLHAFGLSHGHGDTALEGWLPLGAVIGVARLVAVSHAQPLSDTLTDTERALGNYDAGRFGWVLDDAHALPDPLPCRGFQQLWRLTPIQTDMIHALLRLSGTPV